jgi:hypothetical protein
MRLRLLLAFLLLSPVVALSQTYFGVNGWCTVGAQATVTQGLSSSGTKPISGGTFSQNSGVLASYPKCTISVYATGTTTLSPIYANAGGNVLANPFTGNTDGSFLFFGLAGCYDVVTSSGITTGSTMPQSKTYTDVCVGASSGGGGTVGPGIVNQIAKFISVNNVGNSSGFDDGVGLTQWPVGLTSMGSAYGKLYPNSVNGTTANYLACIDSTVTTVAEVTTCPTSTTKAIGIVHAGTAGITGNAQVTMMGFDSCIFDNQTVVGDYVGPSTTTAGQCTDLGGTRPASFQGVGRITTLNNGAGTAAIIDLGPWDLFSPGSTGFGQCNINNANGYFSGGNLLCDQFFTDDGAGNAGLKSLLFTDATYAMFMYFKQGPTPPATPANTTMLYAGTSVSANSFQLPQAAGAADVGKFITVTSSTTDSNGNPADILAMGSPTGAHGLSFTIYNSGGLASGSTTASTDYLTVPFACTIQAYNLVVDTGTITVKFWKIATGTAIPTSSNSINTSGVSISTGTAIHSTTLSDFTTTTVTANDIMAMNITAASGPTYVNGVLQCQ